MAKDTCKSNGALFGYNAALWAIFQVYNIYSDPIILHILHIDYQSRWRKSEEDVWSCALHGRILSLHQDATHLHYRAVFPRKAQDPLTPPPSVPTSTPVSSLGDNDTEALVHHYLNLSPNLTDLYEQWSVADANFKRKAPKFAGLRILKQDAWEALVGFICSSNNNIIRISQMVC